MCLQVLEFTHFACTSEDINNLAYALMLQEAISHHVLPALDKVAQMRPSWCMLVSVSPPDVRDPAFSHVRCHLPILPLDVIYPHAAWLSVVPSGHRCM